MLEIFSWYFNFVAVSPHEVAKSVGVQPPLCAVTNLAGIGEVQLHNYS